MQILLSIKDSEKDHGYMEGPWHHFCKHVCFFAYNLRMERDKVLILTWLSAHRQFLSAEVG